MARFRDFIRRVKKQPAESAGFSICTNKISKKHVEHVPSSFSSSEIGSISAAGMQRSYQGSYITTHTMTRHQEPQRRLSSETTIDSDSSKTAVEKIPISGNTTSVWKGAAKGTQYDKREELTPEDEDMWAKLAM